MNCPSRTDNEDSRMDWNQSPNELASSTREDLNGITNTRILRRIEPNDPEVILSDCEQPDAQRPRRNSEATLKLARALSSPTVHIGPACARNTTGSDSGATLPHSPNFMGKTWQVLVTFGKFVGPGFMISVAYIDPGNYATDVAAGASHRFELLFIVLLSNIIAIYLQSLCIKLGTITGLDLAQMCRAHLPRWLNLFLYFLAECAIIATDIAEVIGTAIALNLLIPSLPLVAGCAISIVDVLLILLFYRPNGSMKGLRAFEFFVMALVLGVVICFCIQLSLIKDTPVSDVFRGYLPSTGMLQNGGLYQACGILGATVMPHSLYLGSGICQPRLYDYDVKIGNVVPMSQDQPTSSIASEKVTYQPSLTAINFCMKYSIVELALSLFTFALFVNSAILIVAGASLYASDSAAEASLFGIYDLLSGSIAPAAGTIFALALLLSGISAGIVCTIAGQMVSEGALNWTIAPWMRRLITRSISITPSIIIAGAVGREGLTAALSGSQVALSVALPFISAPLIYFTCRNKYMTVKRDQASTLDENVPRGVSSMEMEGTTADLPRQPIADEAAGREESGDIKMRNHWVTASFAAVVWLIITIMNIANLALLGIGH